MKKNLLLIFCLALFMAACKTEDSQVSIDQKIQFQFAPTSSKSTGGKVTASKVPGSVIVTIKDDTGNAVADRVTLSLYTFGDNYLSLPLTLKVINGGYHLSEFLVTDTNNNIIFATPKRGSALANLVNNPLEIDFTIINDQITTVVPEVLSVDVTSSADDFGYGQFGFQPVETIQTVFSAFIKNASNFELTTAHLKMEAVTDTVTATPFWTNEVDLQAADNKLVVRQSPYYILTATKLGYPIWKHVMRLADQTKAEIVLEQSNELDIYAAGFETISPGLKRAVYWKNGQKITLNTTDSQATQVFVSNGDVYVTNNIVQNHGFYWKNGEKVTLSMTQYAADMITAIFVNGNDVYGAGIGVASNSAWSSATYWKNGNEVTIGTNFSFFEPSDITVDGNDVYIVGNEVDISHGPGGNENALIWKNGIKTILPAPSSVYKQTGVSAVEVKNGHVYAVGSTIDPVTHLNRMIYWHDNEITLLGPADASVFANDILVQDDGTVHLVGVSMKGQTSTGIYFKNGVETAVMNNDDLQSKTDFASISIVGDDVLIGGGFDGKASYWLNGNRTTIDNNENATNSFIRSIVAVRR